MAGIPTSKACKICKTRKIKCDQRWPACSSCKKMGYKCPGPSSLVKFIDANPTGGKRTSPEQEAPPSSSSSTSGRTTSGSVTIQPRPRRMISIEGSASNTDGGSQFSAFRLVTRPNTTAAERIAARMVNNIRDAPDRGMVLSPKFLRELPRRMPESPCVRDSVALYCHVWNTFRRGERIAEFVSLGLYGKAVRSLLRALQSETAVSVETLAAITLLQRTEHLFDSSRSTLSPAHAKGIVHIIKRLGPPEPGDDLHYGLVFENYGTLLTHVLAEGGDSFLWEPEWRLVVEESLSDYLSIGQLNPYSTRALALENTYHSMLSDFWRRCRLIRRDPYSLEGTAMATTLVQELRDFEARAQAVFEPLLEKALETELLTETSDPDCIVGRRYDPAVVYVGQLLLGGWTCQVSLLRTIYDLTDLYGAADEDIYARYRQLCERVWMMSPFLRRLESVIGVASMTAFYFTFEAANAIEKEYILDLFIDLDKYQQRHPKDRASVAAFVMLRAHLLTGRVFLN